jgi:hypothetical protein
MKAFSKLFAMLVVFAGIAHGQTLRFNYLHSNGAPTGSCTSDSIDEDDLTGNLYTCTQNNWTPNLTSALPLINKVIWLDGVKYPYTAAGLQQAVLAAKGSGGLAGVVMIGSTTTLPGLQEIALGCTTITMPSYTYVIGAGRDATGLDLNCQTNPQVSAFDFPRGTEFSGVMNLAVELDGFAPGVCISFEADSVLTTHDNIIQNFSCGSSFAATGQTGLTLTSPGGANGSVNLHDNIFENLLFIDIESPVISNGDFSNRFTGITVEGFADNSSAVNGAFFNDKLDLTVHKLGQNPPSQNQTALTVSGYGNIVELYCDLNQAQGNYCLQDTGGGNHIVVSNLNLTTLGPTGTPNPNSFTENLCPSPVKATLYLPSDTREHVAIGQY